ncbi:hypothetical protein DFQ26_000329 [Actinomortierella ambigua]|nr:hypothetical protein DFQ26_000329 [Actinomortierella ambigua]
MSSSMIKKQSLAVATVLILADKATALKYNDYEFTVGPAMSTGAKIGMAFGVLVVLVLLLVAWIYVKRRKLARQEAAAKDLAEAKALAESKAYDIEQGLRERGIIPNLPPTYTSAPISSTSPQAPAPAHLSQEKNR